MSRKQKEYTIGYALGVFAAGVFSALGYVLIQHFAPPFLVVFYGVLFGSLIIYKIKTRGRKR